MVRSGMAVTSLQYRSAIRARYYIIKSVVYLARQQAMTRPRALELFGHLSDVYCYTKSTLTVSSFSVVFRPHGARALMRPPIT